MANIGSLVRVATCQHGFAQDQCLICQTLGVRQGSQAPATGKVARKVEGDRRSSLVLTEDDIAHALPARQLQPDPPARRQRSSGKASVLAGLVLIVVGGLLVWVFGGLFRLAFHIFEYAALAIVSGWVGYRIGQFRGRHGRRAEGQP